MGGWSLAGRSSEEGLIDGEERSVATSEESRLLVKGRSAVPLPLPLGVMVLFCCSLLYTALVLEKDVHMTSDGVGMGLVVVGRVMDVVVAITDGFFDDGYKDGSRETEVFGERTTMGTSVWSERKLLMLEVREVGGSGDGGGWRVCRAKKDIIDVESGRGVVEKGSGDGRG